MDIAGFIASLNTLGAISSLLGLWIAYIVLRRTGNIQTRMQTHVLFTKFTANKGAIKPQLESIIEMLINDEINEQGFRVDVSRLIGLLGGYKNVFAEEKKDLRRLRKLMQKNHLTDMEKKEISVILAELIGKIDVKEDVSSVSN